MNGTDFLLDTNVVIGFLGGQAWAKAFVLECVSSGLSLAVSQITRMELLSFPDIAPDEEEKVRSFLRTVDVLPLTDAVEARAILVRRATRAKLPDAIVAATAIESGLTLATGDEQLAGLVVAGLSTRNPRA